MDSARTAAVVGHTLFMSGVCVFGDVYLMVSERIDYRGSGVTFESFPLGETPLWMIGAVFLVASGLLFAGEFVLRAYGPWPAETE